MFNSSINNDQITRSHSEVPFNMINNSEIKHRRMHIYLPLTYQKDLQSDTSNKDSQVPDYIIIEPDHYLNYFQ